MRLLFLCHSHPELQAGGTEIFARDLFRTLRAASHDGVFLAGTAAHQRPPSPGTALQTASDQADEVLLWSGGFDSFFLSQTDLHGTIPEFVALLRELAPNIVHVHHTLQLGMEMLPLIRRVAPAARIVMTLHDFYPICASDGQMASPEGVLCQAASLDACRRCHPGRSATDFRLRSLQVTGAFAAVDHFVAPSEFLRQRYVAWGLPADRISVIRNGLPPHAPAPHRTSHDGRRDRFAFFGHINRFKGATVALAASARLSREGVAHGLALHGDTRYQSAEVLQRFDEALAAAPEARHLGAFQRADQPRLIAAADWVVVPSIWWENAPLVVAEAFAHRRPVICADVGGMAEMVRDGVDGLHAAVGDPASFAAVMRRAAETPGLWQRLVDGITPPVSITASATAHLELYGALPPRPASPPRRSRTMADAPACLPA